MTFVERITKHGWTIAVLFACYLRIVGQAIYGIMYHDDTMQDGSVVYVPLWYEGFYFIPSAFYELIALIALKYLTFPEKRWVALQFDFFIACAAFNLIEEIFMKPWEYDAPEYGNLAFGLIYILYSLYRHERIKRVN